MENLNLNNSGVQEMCTEEQKSIDGGIGFLAAAGLIILCGGAGVGAGYGLAYLLD